MHKNNNSSFTHLYLNRSGYFTTILQQNLNPISVICLVKLLTYIDKGNYDCSPALCARRAPGTRVPLICSLNQCFMNSDSTERMLNSAGETSL